MERYGLLVEDVDNIYIHEKLFEDILACIKESLTHSSFCGRRDYFKILNNKEIVSHLHAKVDMSSYYGYLHLCKRSEDESFTITSASKQLFHNLYDCLLSERKNSDIAMNVKIVYFAILSDNQVVSELHKIPILKSTNCEEDND